MTDYLTVADVVGLRAVLVKRYGGSPGLRDAGALESAVFRPKTGYYTDIIEKAAALLESLALNRPFIDGNKRAPFAAMDVFLRINHYRLGVSSEIIYAWIMGMFEKHTFEMKTIEPFLRQHAQPLSLT